MVLRDGAREGGLPWSVGIGLHWGSTVVTPLSLIFQNLFPQNLLIFSCLTLTTAVGKRAL
jgi:hypothetical protein